MLSLVCCGALFRLSHLTMMVSKVWPNLYLILKADWQANPRVVLRTKVLTQISGDFKLMTVSCLPNILQQ